MVCNKCGQNITSNDKFCPKCGAEIKEKIVAPQYNEKSENVVLGTIGAFIGSLAGVIAIVLFNRLGYIASIAGVIMSFCALYMYEKLGGKMSKKGVIISLVIIIIMTLISENIAFSLAVVSEVKDAGSSTTFSYVFFNFYDLMKEGYLNTSSYFSDLAMVYLFTALGAFGTLKNTFSAVKNK